ncbi:hypothetical protein A7982_12860 [Minicystis rosea]|nr:hypothetical protein A7982_12860 [Minicystis rosea]
MPSLLRASLSVLLLSACDPLPRPPSAAPADVSLAAPTATAAATAQPASAPAIDARAYTFDGFKLGSSYDREVMKRAPYAEPCDNDPIDHRARRFMVYGALPCRERTFPEATTVMFYLRFAEDARYEQPIEAFAWLGGNYFATRSNFPLRTGEPASAATAKLGAALGTFELHRKGQRVTIERHVGDVYVVIDGERLVGFVVGPMPADPESEQWRGLMQMYVRYTKPKEP